MKIADVMTPDLETVSPSDTLRTAARLMADAQFRSAPGRRRQPIDRDDHRP